MGLHLLGRHPKETMLAAAILSVLIFIAAIAGDAQITEERDKYKSCITPVELAYRECVLYAMGRDCRQVKQVLTDMCHEHIDNGGSVPEVYYED